VQDTFTQMICESKNTAAASIAATTVAAGCNAAYTTVQ
jgi:hypothetical protein